MKITTKLLKLLNRLKMRVKGGLYPYDPTKADIDIREAPLSWCRFVTCTVTFQLVLTFSNVLGVITSFLTFRYAAYGLLKLDYTSFRVFFKDIKHIIRVRTLNLD
jgi:hypothetical protein